MWRELKGWWDFINQPRNAVVLHRLTIREGFYVAGAWIAGAVPFVLDFSRAGVLIWYVTVVIPLVVGLLRALQMRNQLREPKNKPDDQ